jgi:hypothetical protein
MSSPENNQAPTQVARKCYSVDSGSSSTDDDNNDDGGLEILSPAEKPLAANNGHYGSGRAQSGLPKSSS